MRRLRGLFPTSLRHETYGLTDGDARTCGDLGAEYTGREGSNRVDPRVVAVARDVSLSPELIR